MRREQLQTIAKALINARELFLAAEEVERQANAGRKLVRKSNARNQRQQADEALAIIMQELGGGLVL